jgi:hypothetical protein
MTIAILTLAATPMTLLAQSGSLEGAVSSDSLGKRSLPGVEITLPALSLTTRTNFTGEYHLSGIAPGRYLAIATAVGYRSVGDSITIAASGASYHDFVMAARATVLDSVVSKAPAPPVYISPFLNAFEERRKSGGGGYFLVDSILRQEEDRPLPEIIRMHVPGVSMIAAGSRAYLSSNRGPSAGAMVGASSVCYPDVYLDGVQMVKLPDPQPKYSKIVSVDLAQFSATQLGAVEFYPGGASLPIQFNHTASGCGALLLWTREK